MPMSPDEVAELSRLLDEAQAQDPVLREPWLAGLARTKPHAAQRLRDMLRQAAVQDDDSALPQLPSIDADGAVATAGERVGPYQLVQEIGRGGMGSVWLAERADGTYKRRVALKLPRIAWATGRGKRMARERDIGALLEHPNIARLYDAGVDEHGRPYIAMEYIEGQSIDAYCRDHALDLRARLKLFVEVARAVAYAHGRLVLHRDLKPANVQVDVGGHVHLLDFGIAKLLDEAGAGSDLTQEQGRVLTLNYASPEQIAGRPLGVTADVYSLGVLLFELLTGTMPYKAKRNTTGAMEEAILAGDAPLASSRVGDKKFARELRGDLDAILTKAIKRDPRERYQTAEALAADVQRYLDGNAIEARPDSAWYRLRKAIVRHRVPVMAASAVLLVALVGLATTLVQGQRAADEAERARLATAFVSELFRVSSNTLVPADAGAPRPTQAVLLDRGAQLVEARFERQPAMKAELYGVLGRVYADLGQDRVASEFALRQLKTLQAQKASAHQIANALMLMSETALAAGRNKDAEEYAQQAAHALSRGDALLPDVLVLLARAQILNGKVAVAAETADEARAALKLSKRAESSASAWLLVVDGSVLTLQDKFDEALPLLEAAIAEALRVEGPTSRSATEMQIRLARMLINRNRYEEAKPLGEAAISTLESIGGVHLIRATRAKVHLQQRKFEMGYAGYSESMVILNEALEFLKLQSNAVPVEVIAEVELDMGRVASGYGEYARAEPLVESSARVLRASSQSLSTHFQIANAIGVLRMGLGDHDEADRAFRERMEFRVKMGQANTPFAAVDWMFVARNLSMQGRHAEAETFLTQAPSFGNETGDKSVDYTRVVPEALARIRLDAGNVNGAAKAFPTKSIPSGQLDVSNSDEIERWAFHGELACAAGQGSLGLSQLTMAEKGLSRHVSPNSPELARVRAVTGLCALSLGDRKQAEELASLARRAFIAQPRVSPYFKEPLGRLERQLGTKSI